MSECQCPGPGYCPVRGRYVSAIAHGVCRRGDARSKAAVFGDGRPEGVRDPRRVTPTAARARAAGEPCRYLGGPVAGEDGKQATRLCGPCGGKVRLKVFECSHPGHERSPTTTVGKTGECSRCRDYEARAEGDVTMGWSTRRDTGGLPVEMVAPGDRRPGIFRGGVLQLMVTRACDLACHSCTAGSNLIHKPAVMTPEQFEQAVLSLEGYPGVYGLFGGNPCSSRYFEDYCRILKTHVPYPQRGIWTNNLLGRGPLARQTFCPDVSNINVHMNSDAYAEFKREWPEALTAREEHTTRGLTEDARHGTPWISMTDLGLPEDERWRLIGGCTINKHWSAIVTLVRGELRGFLCEIQGHMAALHADNPDWAGTGAPMPDVGLPVVPGWWRRPLADFEAQVRTCCHHCAIPLNREGQLAVGGEKEEFSPTHEFIARPKVRSRPVEIVQIGGAVERGERPATEYLAGVTPGYKGQ